MKTLLKNTDLFEVIFFTFYFSAITVIGVAFTYLIISTPY